MADAYSSVRCMVYSELFLSVMVAAEKVVGPGGGLVKCPVPGRCVAFSEGFFPSVMFETGAELCFE